MLSISVSEEAFHTNRGLLHGAILGLRRLKCLSVAYPSGLPGTGTAIQAPMSANAGPGLRLALRLLEPTLDLSFTSEQFRTVIGIDKAAWQAELKLHADLFQQLAYHLPKELQETKARIEVRLAA